MSKNEYLRDLRAALALALAQDHQTDIQTDAELASTPYYQGMADVVTLAVENPPLRPDEHKGE